MRITSVRKIEKCDRRAIEIAAVGEGRRREGMSVFIRYDGDREAWVRCMKVLEMKNNRESEWKTGGSRQCAERRRRTSV
jgi:hypothetical protein